MRILAGYWLLFALHPLPPLDLSPVQLHGLARRAILREDDLLRSWNPVCKKHKPLLLSLLHDRREAGAAKSRLVYPTRSKAFGPEWA